MDEWIEASEAAERLNRTERQVYRYGTAGRVRTRRHGRRTQFHAGDITTLAAELGASDEPRPPKPPRQEIMEPGAMLDYLRERDARLEQAQREIQQLIYQLGQKDAELGRRALPEDTDKLRQELEDVKKERDALLEQLNQRKPWWKRW